LGPDGRFSRRATQCALDVQNAQSPSKMTQGISRTSVAMHSTYPNGLLRSPSSLRADRAGLPPSSSSLGDEERVPFFLLSTAARDPVVRSLTTTSFR
jgi:hypothetical protein